MNEGMNEATTSRRSLLIALISHRLRPPVVSSRPWQFRACFDFFLLLSPVDFATGVAFVCVASSSRSDARRWPPPSSSCYRSFVKGRIRVFGAPIRVLMAFDEALVTSPFPSHLCLKNQMNLHQQLWLSSRHHRRQVDLTLPNLT